MKKKALALSLIMALAFASIFYVALIQPVESQSFDTIYIRDNGSVEGTNLIERRDNTYTFLNNISGSIVISKDFITLDGSGFALIGNDDSSQRGINLSNRKNVTVTNMVIMNHHIGVSCGGTASNITFLNNYVSGCGIGIEFLGSSNHLVKFNTFKDNDIDVALDYVSGDTLIVFNNLDSYVQVWLSNQPTMDMNFWADYNGTDSDGDGIGDSPYFYNGILQDNHPLMEPVEIPSSPETTTLTSPTPLSSEEPQLAEQDAILGVAVTVAIVCVGLGLLVYLIKRK